MSQKDLTYEQLSKAEIKDLKRLAEFLGVKLPNPDKDNYKHRLAARIARWLKRNS